MTTSPLTIRISRIIPSVCFVVTLAVTGISNNASGDPAKSPAANSIELDFSPSYVSKLLEKSSTAGSALVCPRVAEPPKIDGVIDDASWKKAPIIDTLKPKNPATRVQLAYDATNLYIAFACTQAAGVPIRAKKYPHNDSASWKDDCVEVFLTLEAGTQPIQSQFIVNAAGSTFEILAGAHGKGEPRWSSAAKTEGDHWTVEMAIPRELLGVNEWPARLSLNVCRNGPLPSQQQSWGDNYGYPGAVAIVMQGVAEKSMAKSRVGASATSRGTKAGASGEGLSLTFDRGSARPGERWIAGTISLSPHVELDRTKVRAELVGMSGDQPLAVQEIKPKLADGRIFVDLRSHNLAAAQVVVRLFENGKETSVARALLAAEPALNPLQTGQKISLTVDTAMETGPVKNWPVTVCVPFSAGALWDQNQVRLVNTAGKEIPSQTEILGRWSREGSIQWLRFDTKVSSGERYFAEYSPSSVQSASRETIQVKEEGSDRIVLDTGVARYVIAKGNSPIREIWLGKQKVATCADARGLYVIDQKGQLASASADGETLEVEAAGSQAACVRLEGFYKTKSGEQLARHITRIEAFAGQPFAKVMHTLVLSRDSNEVWFKEIGWELAVNAGKQAAAVFGVNRDKPSESYTQPLGSGVTSAYMVQDQHYRFVTGTNHFHVATGNDKTVKDGAECGDWAALVGDQSALMMGCAESARQHPKEFEISANKVTLKLFSPRAGEELDFRSPALIKKWNLKEWLKVSESVLFEVMAKDPSRGDKTYDEFIAKHYAEAEKLPSNAVGWAKTHDLVFAPLASASAATEAPVIAGTLTFPVYVHVDPLWIYQTDALGPLHPKDINRFPEAEDFLQKLTERFWIGWEARMGLYGFLDFNEGPPNYPSREDPEHWANMARYKLAYRVRGDLLLMAARSGQRDLMSAAIATNRKVYDDNFAHWDGPRRSKGGWILPAGGDGTVISPSGLPYSWEGATQVESTPTEIPENLINLYYLTGDRRAKEVVEDYLHFAKAEWSPTKLRNLWYPMRYEMALVWGYGFTWDRELGELAEASLNLMYDPQSPLLINTFTYSPTYKIQQEVRDIIRTQYVLSDPRYYELAMARSRYLMQGEMFAINYQNSQGIVSSFLYRQTGEPSIAEKAAMMVRQASSFYDPETKKFAMTYILSNCARVGMFMNGIFYGEDAVARSNADRKPVATWAGASFWDDEKAAKPGQAGSVIFLKQPKRPLSIQWMGSAIVSQNEVQITRLNGKSGDWATDLNQLTTLLEGTSAQINIEKYAPEGAYEIKGGQVQYAVANELCPMVVCAPGNWTPYPDQRPFPPIWFKVPADAKDAKIVFEGSARLFDPQGKAFPNEKAATGEIKLPADRPGLWSFQPVENKKVRVVNLPPFFAFRDPAFYFEPPLSSKAQ